jgi:hypothetical protein
MRTRLKGTLLVKVALAHGDKLEGQSCSFKALAVNIGQHCYSKVSSAAGQQWSF